MYINQIRLWKNTGECFVITNMNHMVAYPYCTIRYLKDSKIDTVFLKRIDEDSILAEEYSKNCS